MKNKKVKIIALYALSVGLILLPSLIDDSTAIAWTKKLETKSVRWGYSFFFYYGLFKYSLIAIGVVIPIVLTTQLLLRRE